EGQAEELAGGGAVGGQQPGDAAGDDGGLAGAGAGDDQQGAQLVDDGVPLGRGQLLKEGGLGKQDFRHGAAGASGRPLRYCLVTSNSNGNSSAVWASSLASKSVLM